MEASHKKYDDSIVIPAQVGIDLANYPGGFLLCAGMTTRPTGILVHRLNDDQWFLFPFAEIA